MQKNAIKNQLNKQIAELQKELSSFETRDSHSVEDVEQFLKLLDAFHKLVAVYEHAIKNTSTATELDVHLKIIQAVEKKEEAKAEIKNTKDEVKQVKLDLVPEVKEKKEDKIISEPLPENKPQASAKKVELGINDKYRVINELFGQQQAEFNAALQQLNAVELWSEAEVYLDSLGDIYQWKEENPLVKTFYSLVKKRFS